MFSPVAAMRRLYLQLERFIHNNYGQEKLMLQRNVLTLKRDKSFFSTPSNVDTLVSIAARHNL
jgi:hypothetical protein